MEAKVSAMEKAIETSELLEIIVETEAEAGVSGMSVAGGGKEGLFIKDVLKDSPAARALSLKEGDQLLSARVYFDNIKYEDALQILKCAEPYKVSFCLKRTVPSADVSRKPGTTTFEVRGPKAKIAKLNIQSLSSLKKKKKKKMAKVLGKQLREATDLHGSRDLAGGRLEIVPVDVEFSLPKFSKLRKAKSAGEVAVAEPSPDLSPRLSSLETKRRKLKFPRLKVKEAAAAAAAAAVSGARVEGPESRLEVGLPKVAIEVKAATKKEAEGKVSRFAVPFAKAKKAKEEAGGKVEVGFQAPQVELDLPLPKAGPSEESPKAGAKGESFKIQAPQIGLPKMEVVLPKVSTVGMEVPSGGLQAGLKLPTAEVAAPKVDVDLRFPKLEGTPPPEVVPKGEGFRIKVPKLEVSAEEVKLKLPSGKVPDLEVVLEKDKVKSKDLEEKLKAGVTMPSLDVEAPSVDLELPLPKGKAEVEAPKPRVEVPEVSLKVPSISLGKLVSKAPAEGESRLPEVELTVGKPESPKVKAKGPKIQIPGFGISMAERKSESKEAAATVTAESKVMFTGLKMPSLDISAPKISDMQLPKTTGELAKSEEAAEGPGFRFQMPQVSLPKFDLPAKAPPSPPLQIHTKVPKPEGDLSVKVSVPKVDLALPAVTLPDVQLPKTPCQKPELDISVEKPKVEVAVPSARLSFPSGAVPALDIDLPKVEVGLDLPKVEREPTVSEPLPPRDHDIKLKLPTFEAVSKELEVELSVPTCQLDQPELEPSVKTFEGPDVSRMVAKIPKVDLALGKELPPAEGEKKGLEIGLDMKGKPLPKISLEREGKMKLPSVEIPAVTIPDVTIEGSKVLEAEAKQKSPRFALPKFSISGPKVRKASPEAAAPELEASEAADKGSKLKMPKFGISFPKSKWGAEVESPRLALGIEGKAPKGKHGVVSEPQVGLDSFEGRMKLPTMEVEVPSVAVDIGLPKGKAEEWVGEETSGPSPEVGIDLPDVKLTVPKVSLPKFGGKGKEGELELKSREAKTPEKEAKAKGAKFKMPSFSMMRRDVEVSGLEAEAKIKKSSGSPKQKGPSVKMPSMKMPTLEVSSPKLEADKGKLQLQAPELEVKVPQVELPRISTKEGKAEAGLLVGSESPTFKMKMPSLEIAVPSPRAEGELEKPVVDVSEADIRGYEGELKIPRVPSIGISAPKVELDISLPTPGRNESIPPGPTGSDVKIVLPKVELPKFGRGEDGGIAEAGVQLLGHKLGLGWEGEKEAEGAAEGSILGSKVRVPRVHISLPKARLSDAELPLTEGERVAEEAEGKFKMPSVGLPKFSTPKMKAPEVELDASLEAAGKMPKVKVSGPAIKLPRFGGSTSDGEGEAELDLPKVPQLELKAPKLRGSTEMLNLETGTKEVKIKMPSLPIGFGLGKSEVDAGLGSDDSKFKLKLPSLSITKAGTESSTDTQPLCPPAEEADFSFKMPQIALPDVGFSVNSEGKKEAKEEPGKLAGMADLEVDVGGFEGKLKMPKIKMPVFGLPGPKADADAAAASPPRHRQDSGGGDLEGKKAAFKVPGLEISAPSVKAHAEYEVEKTQLRHGGSQELEEASKRGHTGSDGRKSPVGKGEGADADAGKKYKVKIPRFGLTLPKAGLETGEGIPGQEAETKAKRPMFALGRAKAKGPEGSSGLLEGEEEADGKGMMAKLKLRPAFGLSLSKAKVGLEVNGDMEEASSKLKVPKLGFSAAEESAQLNGERAEASLQNGAQESKGKMGKIRLPQVELSSPSKMAETDPELNLKLVRAEEAKEDTHGSGSGGGSSGTFAALKVSKFKSPKITFSGFKKRNGEASSGAVVSSSARTEMASLESGDAGAKGEKSPKFRFPKLALSPKSHGVLEITSEHPEDEGGLKINLPTVGFSGGPGSEEPGPEAGLGPVRVVTKPEGGAVAKV